MRYLTARQVAERLGVDLRTVHRMARSGRLRIIDKLPGRTGAYLFHPATIDKAQQRQEADT
jgi:excisionase family DNA binding protein